MKYSIKRFMLGGKTDPTDVKSDTVRHNNTLDRDQQQPNYLGVGRGTPAGRQLADLSEAEAQSFRRANPFNDPFTNQNVNFGEFQDSFVGDNRAQFDQDFNANSQLMDRFGSSQNYYDYAKQNTGDNIKRRSNATTEEFRGRFTDDYIGQSSIPSSESLGEVYNNFENRIAPPRPPSIEPTTNMMGGKMGKKPKIKYTEDDMIKANALFNAANQF